MRFKNIFAYSFEHTTYLLRSIYTYILYVLEGHWIRFLSVDKIIATYAAENCPEELGACWYSSKKTSTEATIVYLGSRYKQRFFSK